MTREPIELLFEDEHLLAIDKPSGLRTLPDGFQPQLDHVRSLLEPRFGRLWIVHRLDKDTSGVLLLARNLSTHHALNDQFSNRQIRKEYHALVAGVPTLDRWEVALPLRINGDRDHRTVVDSIQGKSATTVFEVLQRFPSGYSLLIVRPLTGYTHQIRAHLAACGLPIAGDPLYHARPHPSVTQMLQIFIPPKTLSFGRLGLHANSIQFTHPANLQVMVITATHPPDFAELLNQAGQD